jgi:hypothetical protein
MATISIHIKDNVLRSMMDSDEEEAEEEYSLLDMAKELTDAIEEHLIQVSGYSPSQCRVKVVAVMKDTKPLKKKRKK